MKNINRFLEAHSTDEYEDWYPFLAVSMMYTPQKWCARILVREAIATFDLDDVFERTNIGKTTLLSKKCDSPQKAIDDLESILARKFEEYDKKVLTFDSNQVIVRL
jgi:hypothetical protein